MLLQNQLIQMLYKVLFHLEQLVKAERAIVDNFEMFLSTLLEHVSYPMEFEVYP